MNLSEWQFRHWIDMPTAITNAYSWKQSRHGCVDSSATESFVGADPYGGASALIIVSSRYSRLFMACNRIVSDVEPLTQRTHP